MPEGSRAILAAELRLGVRPPAPSEPGVRGNRAAVGGARLFVRPGSAANAPALSKALARPERGLSPRQSSTRLRCACCHGPTSPALLLRVNDGGLPRTEPAEVFSCMPKVRAFSTSLRHGQPRANVPSVVGGPGTSRIPADVRCRRGGRLGRRSPSAGSRASAIRRRSAIRRGARVVGTRCPRVGRWARPAPPASSAGCTTIFSDAVPPRGRPTYRPRCRFGQRADLARESARRGPAKACLTKRLPGPRSARRSPEGHLDGAS